MEVLSCVEDAAGMMKKSKHTGGRKKKNSCIFNYSPPHLISSSSATVRCNEPASRRGSEALRDRVIPVASGNRTDVLSGGRPDAVRFLDAAGMTDESELDAGGRKATVSHSRTSCFFFFFLLMVNGSIFM